MSASAVTVTGTATLLVAANPYRNWLVIDNTSTSTVYIGDSSAVTAATGFALYTLEKLMWESPPTNEEAYWYKGAIYGILSTGSAVVRVVEFNAARI